MKPVRSSMVEVLPRRSGPFIGKTAIPSGTVTRADVSMIGASATTMPLTSPVSACELSLGTTWPLLTTRPRRRVDLAQSVSVRRTLTGHPEHTPLPPPGVSGTPAR